MALHLKLRETYVLRRKNVKESFSLMNNYYEQKQHQQSIKLNSTLAKLPQFCRQFIIGIKNTTQISTQLRYTRDLIPFFQYFSEKRQCEICNMSVHILDTITAAEIEQYLFHLQNYTDCSGHIRSNGRVGIKSKLSAIRALYRYCFHHQLISFNTSELVDIPVIEKKLIKRLSTEQVEDVLKNIESGIYLSNKEYAWNKILRVRDYALMSLLLGTGIRVSECVGIDNYDIDFLYFYVKIVRKGGKEDRIYFSDEVCNALLKYKQQREQITAKNPLDATAFFLSKNRTRLSVRAIQNITHKYTRHINEVSPHKLRATYATNLYVATKDIYYVSNVLGHSSVETTKKYYAEVPDELKRNMRNTLKLR